MCNFLWNGENTWWYHDASKDITLKHSFVLTIGSTRSFDLSNAEFSRKNHDQGKFNTWKREAVRSIEEGTGEVGEVARPADPD